MLSKVRKILIILIIIIFNILSILITWNLNINYFLDKTHIHLNKTYDFYRDTEKEIGKLDLKEPIKSTIKDELSNLYMNIAGIKSEINQFIPENGTRKIMIRNLIFIFIISELVLILFVCFLRRKEKRST